MRGTVRVGEENFEVRSTTIIVEHRPIISRVTETRTSAPDLLSRHFFAVTGLRYATGVELGDKDGKKSSVFVVRLDLNNYRTQ